MDEQSKIDTPDVFVMKFADSKVPVFKEVRNKDYIKYGEDNLYPNYLTYLFNKSAKNNGIITNKAKYIFGGGYENGNVTINRLNESLNDVAKKAILDIEIYGGFRLEVIWDKGGRVAEIYHVDYSCIRKGKAGGFYYKENWEVSNRDQEKFLPAFNPAEATGSQMFSYDEYRPMSRYYPLPGYIGCNNYIEIDIEISKYYLSAIINGFMPSKLVEFISGELPDEKKKEIERRWSNKFTGSENAGKFIFATASSKEKSINITDLSSTDLDKMWVELNKTTQQEIFSGHNITSPMLFGIMEPGKLGGSSELKTAYQIFINTYAKPKAEAFDKEIGWLVSYTRLAGKYELTQTDPIGIQFDVKDVLEKLPLEFIFKELGIPKEMWSAAGSTIAPAATAVNDVLTNLTGKQKINIDRIVRHYENGKTTRAQAVAMLKKGYGLDDEDIIAFLGEDEPVQAAMSFAAEDEIIGMFDACGEDRDDYKVVTSKTVSFSSVEEAEADEISYQAAFKKFDISKSEQQILDAVRINPKVTVKEINDKTRLSETYINTKIRGLINEGYLEGDIGSLLVPPRIVDIIKNPPSSNNVQIFIKYSYEGPQDSRNRPFCAKMMQLNRLYSRADIEQISQRLGYSVFDRRGGFWNNNGQVLAHCRHDWKSNIVIKKGGDKK